MGSSEIEYVELEEELLPALTVGVRRLSDGVNALKVYLENISEHVSALREESSKLKQILEADRRTLEEERRRLIEQSEVIVKTFENLLDRLDRDVKAMLDLGLGGIASKLSSLTSKVDLIDQDIQAFKLENKNRVNDLINQAAVMKEEIYGLKSKLEEFSILIYDLEMRIKYLEESMATKVNDLGVLLTDLALTLKNSDEQSREKQR